MKFNVISAPYPYNIILVCPGLRQLMAMPSIIHGRIKFPIPWGIATLVSQTATMFECRKVGKENSKEPVEKVKPQEEVGPTEEVLFNLAHPDQLVTTGKNLSSEGSIKLKDL
ncbi:hypothetical protein Tco_0485872, partial [Tanacetum coccineum]